MRKPLKVHRFGHSCVVTVPKHLLEKLGWKAGTEVCCDSVDGRLIVTDMATRTKDLLEIRIREAITNVRRLA